MGSPDGVEETPEKKVPPTLDAFWLIFSETYLETNYTPATAERYRALYKQLSKEFGSKRLGERAAVTHDLTFLNNPPDGFQGRVVPLDAPAYVAVTDGERLVVLPATRDLRAHADRTVTLARDASGKHLRIIAYEFDRGR